MNNLLTQAQSGLQIAPKGGFTGFGPLGTAGSNGVSVFSKFISSIVGLMTIIAIIWFVFTFIAGAIGIIGAGSDKNALEGSRKKIVNGIIGLVVTVAAIFIINLVGYLLGFKNILDIGTLINSLNK
ncbi:MAG TPA: hypothetical protein VKC53_00525 [Patescibacteria group bacterium]|nr:hypothetical protein [Patescibacteria group bacterium]